MKTLTSFSYLKTGDGDRISYTYSEVDGQGNIISQQNKGNFIIMEDVIKESTNTIINFIKENRLGETAE